MSSIFQSLLNAMSEYASLCCAAFQVLCYKLYKLVCCVKDPPPTPEFNVICLGLSRSGKSTALAVLAKESIETQPTIGFSIKAVQLSSCILNIKEVGGSDQVRPYWPRYYQHAQGLVFVVDGSAEDLGQAAAELERAYANTALTGLPLLLLVTHHDRAECRSVDEVAEVMNVRALAPSDGFVVHICRSADHEGVRHGFTRFGHLLLPPGARTK